MGFGRNLLSCWRHRRKRKWSSVEPVEGKMIGASGTSIVLSDTTARPHLYESNTRKEQRIIFK
jgi:hypothetical protein